MCVRAGLHSGCLCAERIFGILHHHFPGRFLSKLREGGMGARRAGQPASHSAVDEHSLRSLRFPGSIRIKRSYARMKHTCGSSSTMLVPFFAPRDGMTLAGSAALSVFMPLASALAPSPPSCATTAPPISVSASSPASPPRSDNVDDVNACRHLFITHSCPFSCAPTTSGNPRGRASARPILEHGRKR